MKLMNDLRSHVSRNTTQNTKSVIRSRNPQRTPFPLHSAQKVTNSRCGIVSAQRNASQLKEQQFTCVYLVAFRIRFDFRAIVAKRIAKAAILTIVSSAFGTVMNEVAVVKSVRKTTAAGAHVYVIVAAR